MNEDVFPIENGGYSIAMLVYQRVRFHEVNFRENSRPLRFYMKSLLPISLARRRAVADDIRSTFFSTAPTELWLFGRT